MKKIRALLGLALIPMAAIMTVSPSGAYYQGDTVHAATDAPYCKTIENLQNYVALTKANSFAEANKIGGCGLAKKDAKASVLDVSFHGYAHVLLQVEDEAPVKVYVQKNRWWTSEEEKYFACMRVRQNEDFGVAFSFCQAASAPGHDVHKDQASFDAAVASKCADCHGATDMKGRVAWPDLSGLPKDYILRSVNAYKSGARNNTVMSGVAQKMSEEDAARAAALFSAAGCK